MRRAGELLGTDGGGGAGLIVDYGGDRVFGTSFRVSLIAALFTFVMIEGYIGFPESRDRGCV